jgi:hypothetical protein
MSKLKLFIPSMIGVMIMFFSYHIETTLESNFKIDRHLASQISVLVESQKIEANAEELINVSFNSLLENNHSLLLKSIDLIWVLGFAFMLWLFPYHIVLRTDKFKI